MKIGDRVFVYGYVDEIRKDTVIIRNNGGYFGTIPNEIIKGDLVRCKDCKWNNGCRVLDDDNGYCSEGEPKEQEHE